VTGLTPGPDATRPGDAGVTGPLSPDLRAVPGQHQADARVWVHLDGSWRPARLMAAGSAALLVSHLLPGRGTAVDTVCWRQVHAQPRTQLQPRIDGAGTP
jgi:hypothetical protein